MTSTTHVNKRSYDLSWLANYHQIMVIGLGVSGVGVVRKLAEHNISVHVQDSRSNPLGQDEINQCSNVESVHFGSFDQQAILKSDLLVMSPGVSLQTPEIQAAIEAGIEITGDIDIVSRSTSVPIIAITGSNGKSTVTELAGEMCLAAGYHAFIGGNIGLSAMGLLDEKEQYDLALLEISSFQLETTSQLAADVAVLLNVSADHMDRYDTYEDYISAKLSIYKGAKTRIFNRQDNLLKNVELFPQSTREMLFSFGCDKPETSNDFGIIKGVDKQFYFARGSHQEAELIANTNDCQLIGRHNQMNVLAALALLANVADLSIDQHSIKIALKKFKGMPHRMQKIRKHQGVLWINDSKATNVGATQSALEGLQGSIILIAGGQGKGGDFSALLPQIKRYVKHVFLMGEDTHLMRDSWQESVDCTQVDSLDEAVVKAHKFAIEGDTVILAPACASFDMFASFDDRGEQFITLVNEL